VARLPAQQTSLVVSQQAGPMEQSPALPVVVYDAGVFAL
jgi:hypothetical protein